MRKALITGITGFVGSHMCDYLIDEKLAEVHGFLRWRSPLDNIKGRLNRDQESVHLHFGDLLDLSSLYKILKEVKPDIIFHLAAQSLVPYSFDVPIATLDVNVNGTCNLLEAIKILKLETGYDPIVHIVSSSEVYGQVREEDIPITEECPLRPASPYAVSKVGEDMLGLQYWLSYKIKTIRTRMFSHTGYRRHESFVLSNFAKQIVEIEKNIKPPIVYVGNLDSVRTFADVRDAVRAYWLLVNHCQPGEVYNIGGNTTVTIKEMLNILLSYSLIKNVEIKVDPKRLRPSDVTLQIPCSDKFKKVTGWEPEIRFSTTVQSMLNYWRERVENVL